MDSVPSKCESAKCGAGVGAGGDAAGAGNAAGAGGWGATLRAKQ